MKEENKPTINDRVVIYLKEDKTYTVRNTKLGLTVDTGIKTPDEALAIKKAYCFGYYDGRDDAKKELKQ